MLTVKETPVERNFFLSYFRKIWRLIENTRFYHMSFKIHGSTKPLFLLMRTLRLERLRNGFRGAQV